jgi:DNA-binding transcriptional MocR family regulator
MNFERTRSRSGYLHWAKTVPPASSNLATSGIARLPLDELPFDGDDWELSPPGGYGYPPLQERLAEKCHVSLENVIAATGASMANFLAMAAVLEPGDEVLIEHPTSLCSLSPRIWAPRSAGSRAPVTWLPSLT